VGKPDLGNVTWPQIIFRFFETFCGHVPHNKLCGNTNFIIIGPTHQKLWVFKIFRRSLGRAGMTWRQPGRVDHMYKNMWTWGKTIFLQESSLGHPRAASSRPLVARQPTSRKHRLAVGGPGPVGNQWSPTGRSLQFDKLLAGPSFFAILAFFLVSIYKYLYCSFVEVIFERSCFELGKLVLRWNILTLFEQ
jgi:hypothetical protein